MKIEILYEGGSAGYLDAESILNLNGKFEFMPYRSYSHLKLGESLQKKHVVEVMLSDGISLCKSTVESMEPSLIVLKGELSEPPLSPFE